MNQLKSNRLRALGFTGTLNDMEVAFFKSKGLTNTTINGLRYAYFKSRGGTGLSVNDIMFSVFATLGYAGTLNDKERTALVNNQYYV